MGSTETNRSAHYRNGIIHNEKGPGMDDVRLVMGSEYDKEFEYPDDKIVGTFGILDGGMDILVGWRVSGTRKDRRHGVIDREICDVGYSNNLYDAMFARWRE